MKKYEAMAGENISETAKAMVALAKKTNDTVETKFNDIVLTATSDSNADAIIADYHTKMEVASEAYHNSPEGKKAAREAEERKQRAQQKHDVLMRQLPNLNFGDDVAVLDWLCEFQDPSDYIGVVKQQDVVVATFATHGYQPNANCGKDFNGDNRDNFARYIIGQALGGLTCEVGAIHQIIHKFTDDWKKKFLSAAA